MWVVYWEVVIIIIVFEIESFLVVTYHYLRKQMLRIISLLQLLTFRILLGNNYFFMKSLRR